MNLDVRLDGRLPDPIELAAYYAVAETLTNTVKHAGATAVNLEVSANGDEVSIVVRDDGRGGASLADGTGLIGLKDRIDAIGGRMTLRSPPVAGTTLTIALPLGRAGGGRTTER